MNTGAFGQSCPVISKIRIKKNPDSVAGLFTFCIDRLLDRFLLFRLITA